MIFSALNESGVPSWLLIAQGKKTVSRRSHPIKVGSIRSVQPARAKKAVCHVVRPCKFEMDACYRTGISKPCYSPLRIQILSCEEASKWMKRNDATVRVNWWERELTQEQRSEYIHKYDRATVGELFLNAEARREGFNSWAGLQDALRKCYPKGIPPLWRVSFKVI